MNLNALAANLSVIALLGLSTPLGCGSKQDGADAGDTETVGATTGTTGDASGVPTTGTTTTGTTTTGTTTTGAPTTDGTSGDPTGTSGGGAPNGEVCTESEACMSGKCYVLPALGGYCGECEGDADCADTTMGGCTPPNPFMDVGSRCNMGEAGGGCETNKACMDGLTCSLVFDLIGVITMKRCGECESTADCAEGTICAPLVSVEEFGGVNACIAPGTLTQDAYCLLEGNGDQACMSGICSTVNVMDFATMGACGECNTDADCGGATCAPGEFDPGSGVLTGSRCV